MTRNFVQPGDTLTLLAPVGGTTLNVPLLIGGLLVIPDATRLVTEAFEGQVAGVFNLTKAPSQAWVEGGLVYWDTANLRASSDPAVGGPVVGVSTAVVAGGAGDTLADVLLLGAAASAGAVRHIRRRFTVAELDAGATLVQKVPGLRYRMIDAQAIAIGGDVTTVTTIDIIGDVGGARKLVAFGVAALTEDDMVRVGEAGGVHLAAGASFTTNDAGDAILVGTTGAAITVATHVDISFTYAIDG